MFGAAHGFEIPFVFGRFEHLGDADRLLFTRRTRTDREGLSRAIGHYWASFARDGHPTCPGQPDWPRYRSGHGPYLRLDTDNDGGIGVVAETDSTDRLAADLAGDPTLDDQQRRSIVDEMGNWLFTRPIQAQVRAFRKAAATRG